VRLVDKPLLVLAGAGSGKTRVITAKIAYLIEKLDLPPRQIAAVTFTNKAAKEMRERVSQTLRKPGLDGLRISTFHTLGLNIIRQDMDKLDFRPGFSIYDNQDSSKLIGELIRRSGVDASSQANAIQATISRWKNAFLSPEQVLGNTRDEPMDVLAAAVYAEYNQALKSYNAVDFDDLIMLPVLLFRTHPEVLQAWRHRIRYLLVDECQDTNATQYELVKLLCGGRDGLTVVGDDDQSIYAWRGAQPENMALLKQDFPTLEVIKLEQNYRSMGHILKAANTLIANNPHVFEKRLWSEMGHGEGMRVLNAANEEDEAEKVITHLVHHRVMHACSYGDYAILYRSNHQSRIFERQLRERNIPYQISGGTSFFSYTEVRDILAYLRLLVNPDDDNAFLRIINTPRREIGPATLEKLATYAQRREISLYAACFELGLGEYIGPRPLQKLRRFSTWMGRLGEGLDPEDPLATVRLLIDESGYQTWLEDNSPDLRGAERRMQNVHELVDWLQHLQQQDNGLRGLEDLVARVMLLDMLERNEDQQRDDQVQLMTLHACKGLEFPYVFMVGMEENLLPHRNSIEEEDIEEERRLAYVGITRARRHLTFSLTRTRRRYGEIEICEPSRFLAELPQEDLLWDGRQQDDPAKNRAEGKAHLSRLRELLQQG